MSEKKLLNDIMLAHTESGSRLFRNNVGVGWAGKFIRRYEDGSVLIGNARPLHAGLCVGSSDLIGWTTVLVRPDMVGSRVSVFTATECKTGRLKQTEVQKNFLKMVVDAGGFGFESRSVDQYTKRLESFTGHSKEGK